MSTAHALGAAIDTGRVADRLWLYSNYHCNLHCSYCLTESAPGVSRRILAPDQMVEAADQARALGFRSLGVTGGEPFLIPEMPEILAELARRLPVVVLSNATLFTTRLVERMRPLAELPVTVQVSLDSAEPDVNDEMRGPRNFARWSWACRCASPPPGTTTPPRRWSGYAPCTGPWACPTPTTWCARWSAGAARPSTAWAWWPGRRTSTPS